MKTILLIEDEDLVRTTLRLVLARAGYQVLPAACVAEARSLWADAAARVDLVISDNSLPDGSGVVLVHEFETARPGLPIIIASGSTPRVPPHYYHLAKPFNSQFLLAFVKCALEKSRFPCP